ncbi:MAG TPA: hypothetical protein VGJ70_00415 [Solirubrobacteraceae bacterium]
MARRRRRRRATPRPLDVALAATLHDPRGRLAHDIERALPRLQQVYRGIAVATSPPTAPRVRTLLARAGVHAGTPSSNVRGPLYRMSIRGALATGTSRVHYLDLDRTLHWLRRAPRELRAALRVAYRHPVLVIGRTAKAHRSHHEPLWATEVLANRLMATRLELGRPPDLLVPSFVLERAQAERLLERSRARDVAVYGEWAAVLLGLAPSIAYLECRGLDWETPDYHRRAVRRVGLAAWRRKQATPAEWALRVQLATELVRGFERAVGRAGLRGVVLQRIAPRVG